MFTRIVELTAKNGKQRELTRVVDDKVVPILKKQTGFVDEIVLNSDTEPERVVSVSFWKRREDGRTLPSAAVCRYPRHGETLTRGRPCTGMLSTY